jgi:hypothetical protein
MISAAERRLVLLRLELEDLEDLAEERRDEEEAGSELEEGAGTRRAMV